MKKFSLFLAILTLALSASAARWHQLNVGTFEKLIVENDINVTCLFTPDSVGYVRYYCDDKYSDGVMFDRTKQDRLKVYISPDFIDEIDNLPEIIVYTDKLEMVKSSSNKTVNIVDPARVLKFNARLIGNGRLNVTGLDTDRAVGEIVTGNGVLSLQGRGNDTLLKLTGTGTIQAHDLDAEKVTCHVFGSGDIYCYPQDTLVLKGLGSTRVHYRGLPKTIKKSGFGKLLPME